MIIFLVLLLCASSLTCMELNDKYLDVCPGRLAYMHEAIQQGKEKGKEEEKKELSCVFDNEHILANNQILEESHANGIRIMMNKYPYFKDGQHVLVMPIAHIEHPHDFSCKQIRMFVLTAHRVSRKLCPYAYRQELITAWGEAGGQSVRHWHSHVKNYTKPPRSLAEQMHEDAQTPTITKEQLFEETKKMLRMYLGVTEWLMIEEPHKECLACMVGSSEEEGMLKLKTYNYNYVCVSHYPSVPGELSVVPKRHVASISELSPDEFEEHMIIAMALFPRVKHYAQEFISQHAVGGTLFTKSSGAKTSECEQQKYHVHTVIMPRTTIVSAPGALTGSSCKLEMDPFHFFNWMKKDVNRYNSLTDYFTCS